MIRRTAVDQAVMEAVAAHRTGWTTAIGAVLHRLLRERVSRAESPTRSTRCGHRPRDRRPRRDAADLTPQREDGDPGVRSATFVPATAGSVAGGR
jgi:hypothetical protein